MKLAIFDVDGTISDSQAHILAAMTEAFGLEPDDPLVDWWQARLPRAGTGGSR